jgi:hypothetical protein
MRLLKLAIYGLLGYLIYELVQGMSAGAPAAMQRGGGGQPRQARGQSGMSSGSRRGGGAPQRYAQAQNMTGPGEGRVEEAADTYGTSVPHRVGRGVV